MTTDRMINAFYKPGVRIRVVNCRSYKRRDYSGMFGTIVENLMRPYGIISVELDGEENPVGGHGRFYFRPDELEIVNGNNVDILEENNMQNVINYFNIVKVKYLDNDKVSSYDYANFDMDLKVGDLCVVASAHHGFGLARVTEVIERNDVKTPREIVARVDTSYYDGRVTDRKKAAELKAKMQERAKQLQDITLYQMLAEKDQEMKDLLKSYESLRLY